MPNIAIIDEINRSYSGIDLLYIGSRGGMEESLIKEKGWRYKGVYCGKLRRYFSLKNLVDLFKTPIGVIQAFFAIRKFKPDTIFCKGGFVSFPVSVAGFFLKKRVILHESDVIPGLANRLASKYASLILVSYEESKKYFIGKPCVVTGNPVRKDLLNGKKENGYKLTGLDNKKPIILVTGGSQGSTFLNRLVLNNIDKLLKKYQVIHLCGKGNGDATDISGYKQFEFVKDELKDIYAITDLVISRAGANALAEIKEIGKPAILFPLGTSASRGDQIVNAEAFQKEWDADVFNEDSFVVDELFSSLERLLKLDFNKTKTDLRKEKTPAVDKIVKLIMNQ